MSNFIERQKKQFDKLGWRHIALWLMMPFLLIFLVIREGYKFFHMKISNKINNKLRRKEKQLMNWLNKFTGKELNE